MERNLEHARGFLACCSAAYGPSWLRRSLTSLLMSCGWWRSSEKLSNGSSRFPWESSRRVVVAVERLAEDRRVERLAEDGSRLRFPVSRSGGEGFSSFGSALAALRRRVTFCFRRTIGGLFC